jgi:uncharacterized protein with HEPN domain
VTDKTLRAEDYVGHMLEAVANVLAYTKGFDEARLRETPVVRDAVIRNLEVLGEAARSMIRHAPAVVAANPQIPWDVIYATRNRLSHGYMDIDLHVVWQVVSRELPGLRQHLADLAGSLSSRRDGT